MSNIIPGLGQPVQDAQQIFRAALKAMSEPGSILEVPAINIEATNLSQALYGLALTLFDQDTPILFSAAMQDAVLIESLKFHNAIATTDAYQQAQFVVCSEQDVPELSLLNLGTDAYPDQSTSVLIVCDVLQAGNDWQLSGPGIQTSCSLTCSGLTDTLLDQRQQLSTLFPRGVDLFFCSGQRFFCLPRTTQVEKGV